MRGHTAYFCKKKEDMCSWNEGSSAQDEKFKFRMIY